MSPPESGSSELPALPLPVATHIGVLRVQSESSLQEEDNKEAHRGRRHQALCGRAEKTGLLRLWLRHLFDAKAWSFLKVEEWALNRLGFPQLPHSSEDWILHTYSIN